MQIDLQELQQRYRDMDEDQLLSIDRDDLIEEAQRVYDQEIKRRKLYNKSFIHEKAEEGENTFHRKDAFLDNDGEEFGELENGACACAFTEHPGSDSARTAAKAMEALQAAGIPCQLTETEEEADAHTPARKTLSVMVPGSLIMHATSIVDRDVFNDEYEFEWRTHLESLSDKEFSALDPELICAGMLDRVARITKTYADVIKQRNLKPHTGEKIE
jgi:hypothetical protein